MISFSDKTNAYDYMVVAPLSREHKEYAVFFMFTDSHTVMVLGERIAFEDEWNKRVKNIWGDKDVFYPKSKGKEYRLEPAAEIN